MLPKHIRASQISMNITQIPIDTPQTSPRHLKTSPGKSSCQQTTTDANKHPQTPSDTDRCCLSMTGGVCWRVLLSVDIVSSLEMSEGCLGDIWGYMSDIHRHQRCSDVFGGYLGSPSLHYGAVTLLWHSPERHNFFHLTIMRHQNIKMSIYKGDKNHLVMQLFCFLVPVRKILNNTVALDHPVVHFLRSNFFDFTKIGIVTPIPI